MKKEKKKKQTSKKEKKKKKKVIVKPPSAYNVEIRPVTLDDLKDVIKIFEDAKFDITKGEVEHILKFGMSFGAFVNRQLVAVGLAWPAVFDPETTTLTVSDEPNALYLEDVAVLKKFEGRRIRSMLIIARETEAIKKGLDYVITQESKDPKLKDLLESAYVNYLKFESENGKIYLAKHLDYPLMEE